MDNWVAHNNLGAVYVAMAAENGGGDYVGMAETQLDIANKQQASAEGNANLASVYLMQGNKAKARESAGNALNMNPSNDVRTGVNGVAGAADIMLAEYDRAVRELSGSAESADNMFNKGLAYILTKDYQNALSAFEDATELDGGHAKAYYASAVAYARLQNGTKAAEMLKMAVDNDPSLKEKAATDLEFVNYAGSAEFVEALR